MNLSRQQTAVAKGGAILLMFWHHLFGFPERIPAAAKLISVTGGGSLYVEDQLAIFGRLCVALFLFLSGYGLGHKKEGFTYAKAVGRTLGFYLVFWANFAVVMTAAWFFFRPENGGVIPSWQGFAWDTGSLLKNLFLISPTYSQEWWFARIFVVILLVAWPCCEWLARRSVPLLAFVSITLFALSPFIYHLDRICSWQACFVVGFIFSRAPEFSPVRVFRDIQERLGKSVVYPALTLMLLVFLRKRLGDETDALLAPVFVIALLSLTARFSLLEKGLSLFGKHSASMWLNHTFICYYLFPREFYRLAYTPLLFVTLILLSLALSFATQPVLRLLRLVFDPLMAKARLN